MRLPLDVLICRNCDTSDVRAIGDRRRACPPNMPGADNGYTVDEQAQTPPKE